MLNRVQLEELLCLLSVLFPPSDFFFNLMCRSSHSYHSYLLTLNNSYTAERPILNALSSHPQGRARLVSLSGCSSIYLLSTSKTSVEWTALKESSVRGTTAHHSGRSFGEVQVHFVPDKGLGNNFTGSATNGGMILYIRLESYLARPALR